MSGALTGRRALVTGGSRGIGAEIVRRLTADGAAVGFTYSASKADADELVADVAANGAKAVAIEADAADPTQTAAAVDTAAAELGGLDVVVNNAGIIYFGPVNELTQAQYDRLVAVNIGGTFWTVHSALKHLREGARIINIGSCNADRVSAPTSLSAYAMTKGAISSFTRGLARDLGPLGITVNNVQPGPVITDMNPGEGDFAEYMKKVTALGRYGHTSEVAAMVSFLASSQSSYMTGTNVSVDGGYTA